MKIEFRYDPVLPEIQVTINGTLTNAEDSYGFLYPVRNYLLQNWLYPTGSWSGLARQIVDVARGEAVEIVFNGPTADYDDLCRVAEGAGISTRFIELDTYKKWKRKLQKTKADMKALQAADGACLSEQTRERLRALARTPEEEWLILFS